MVIFPGLKAGNRGREKSGVQVKKKSLEYVEKCAGNISSKGEMNFLGEYCKRKK